MLFFAKKFFNQKLFCITFAKKKEMKRYSNYSMTNKTKFRFLLLAVSILLFTFCSQEPNL